MEKNKLEDEIALLREQQILLEQLELELALQEEQALYGELVAREFLENHGSNQNFKNPQPNCCLLAIIHVIGL